MYLEPTEVPNRRVGQSGWKDTLTRLRPQRYLKRISPFKPVDVEKTGYLKEEGSPKQYIAFNDAKESSVETTSTTSSSQIQEQDSDDSVASSSSVFSESQNYQREQSEGSDMSLDHSRRLPSLRGLNLEERALPPLPQSPKKLKQQLSTTLHGATSLGHTQLRRAATWLGRPFHKLATSSQLHTMVDRYTRATSEPLTIASMPMPSMCTSASAEASAESDSSDFSLMTLEKEPAAFFPNCVWYG